MWIFISNFFFNRYFVFLVQTRCISGFVGENCRGKCTYPYYGMNCEGQGNCDEERCDLSTGCTNLTKGIASAFALVLSV